MSLLKIFFLSITQIMKKIEIHDLDQTYKIFWDGSEKGCLMCGQIIGEGRTSSNVWFKFNSEDKSVHFPCSQSDQEFQKMIARFLNQENNLQNDFKSINNHTRGKIQKFLSSENLRKYKESKY